MTRNITRAIRFIGLAGLVLVQPLMAHAGSFDWTSPGLSAQSGTRLHGLGLAERDLCTEHTVAIRPAGHDEKDASPDRHVLQKLPCGGDTRSVAVMGNDSRGLTVRWNNRYHHA